MKTKANNHISITDNIYYICRTILIIGLPLTIISGLVLSHLSFHSSARISSSDNLSVSVPSSCTLSSSVNEVHSASIINGTYEEGIGKTTLTTFCNDRNGYSVYAIGDSLNSEGNNKLVNDINSNYDIVSGTATFGDTSNWAMKLTGVATITDNNSNTTVNANTPPTIISPFTNYTTIPTEWTKVATIASGTTDMLQGSGFTTTYATYISPTQAAGTYTGQVKYLLTHPSAAEPNTNYFIMQEVANWKDDLDEDESVQAIDIRDGKIYWVAKLKDGHIWMTQNLDTDINSSIEFSSLNTDLNVIYNNGQYAEYSSGYTQVGDIIYWEPASTATTINFTGTTVTGWQNSNTTPYSASKTDDTNTGHASLGNYYNWNTAIASNNSTTITNSKSRADNSICPKGWRLPSTSINNDSYNEFGGLLKINNIIVTNTGSPAYYENNGFNNISMGPLWFTKNGDIDGRTLVNFGSRGRYWTNTASRANFARSLSFNNTGVWPANEDSRYVGMSIRCVAR